MQIVETMCDACGKNDSVTHHELAVGRIPYEIDLCDECYNTRVAPYMELLHTFGRSKAPTVQKVDEADESDNNWGSTPLLTCTLCNYTGRHHSMIKHAQEFHKVGVQVALGAPVVAKCPECDFGFSHTKGMSTHMNTKHNVPYASQRVST